jgi:2-polyprenyl-3-methyl-5-hydroxy-6-metoxy-1,4-benzoquinol methylase
MSVSCNLCDRNSVRALFVKKGFVLGQCKYCNLVYVQNPPLPEELKRLYSFKAGYQVRFRDDDKECQKYIAEAQQHYEFINRYKRRSRILDIGCSAGFFLKVARDHDWDTHGLEISEDSAALAGERYGLNVTIGNLQESTFPPNYFDVITLWDVLEHLDDPKKTLSIANRIIKDSGILVISTPNIDGLFPRLSYRVANLINYWPHPEPPRHLFQFSKKTLGQLLKLTGFTLLEVKSERIPIQYTFGTLQELIRSPKRLFYALIFAPIALAGPMLRAGDSMIVAATKAPAG